MSLEEFEVTFGVHQVPVPPTLLFAIIVNIIAEYARMWLTSYHMQIKLFS